MTSGREKSPWSTGDLVHYHAPWGEQETSKTLTEEEAIVCYYELCRYAWAVHCAASMLPVPHHARDGEDDGPTTDRATKLENEGE